MNRQRFIVYRFRSEDYLFVNKLEPIFASSLKRCKNYLRNLNTIPIRKPYCFGWIRDVYADKQSGYRYIIEPFM